MPGRAWFGWLPWEAGVDVFFVISGFVMVHASARLFGSAGARRVFLRRRLARIVPLYWATTAVFLLAMLALPGRINTPWPDAAPLLASLAFLPWARPDGSVQPVYSLGWTLNYEMFFYAVFALCLPLPRGAAVAAVAAALGLAVLVGALVPGLPVALAFWSDPILLEFVMGMAMALMVARGIAAPGPVRLAMALAGLALLALLPPEWPRALRFGPGATLVVAAALGPTPHLPAILANWLSRLGDASYALYLVHPFALRGTALVWSALGAAGVMAAWLASAAAVLLALAMALACHRWFEAPLTRALAGRS
jgi:peptidoglycan/LPS O-acetylase OafA/YrhL